MTTNRKNAEKAARAHSNLNTYYAVIALMEGGLLYDGRHRIADQIVSLCKRQAATELAIYDRAVGSIKP